MSFHVCSLNPWNETLDPAELLFHLTELLQASEISCLILHFWYMNLPFQIKLYLSTLTSRYLISNSIQDERPQTRCNIYVTEQIRIPIIVTLTLGPIYYWRFPLYPISNDIYGQKIQQQSQIKVHQSFRTQCDPWIWYSKSVIEDLIRE